MMLRPSGQNSNYLGDIMFTRSNGTPDQNNKAQPANTVGEGPRPSNPTPTSPTFVAKNSEGAKRLSIISNDLTIMGQDLKIISKSALQVDGEIQGEIRGIDVTVGELGKVVGTVAAETVTVDGQVMGAIQAVKVTLRKNARVEGDVHHQSLTIEEGAIFDGRSKRHEDSAELVRQLEQNRSPEMVAKASSSSASNASPSTPPPPPSAHN